MFFISSGNTARILGVSLTLSLRMPLGWGGCESSDILYNVHVGMFVVDKFTASLTFHDDPRF